MKYSPKVVAIIPSTCSAKSHTVLKRCIESLVLSANTYNVNLKIVVVSNGKRIILKDFKNKVDILIKVANPYSFAKMNNIAIERILSEYISDWVILINDDVFISKSFFKYFRQKAINKNPDFIVPLIYNHNGIKIDSFGIEYFRSGHPRNSSNLKIKTQLAPAACLLIKTKFLNNMKLIYGFYFNEILESYLEDVEFSIRALGLNAKIVKIKQMIAFHEVSFTNGIKSKYVMFQSYRNLIWLIIMVWPAKYIFKNFFKIVLVQLFMFLQSLNRGIPLEYIRIWISTQKELAKLLILRKKITNSYSKGFKFERALSKYTFRTNHDIKIKFLNIV